MSTLQISLAVLGFIVLAIIVAYNAWNSRRHRPKRAKHAEGDVRPEEQHARMDPGLEGGDAHGGVDITQTPAFLRNGAKEVGSTLEVGNELQEPWAMDAPAAGAAPQPEALEAMPVAAEGVHSGADAGEAALPQTAALAQAALSGERKLALDPLIDAIATLRPEQPMTGDAAIQVQPTTRRAGSKPFRIEGMNTASQQWETVRAGQRYSAFQAGVQLANRLGALNEIEYSEFVVKVQSFADALSAAVDLPDMQHEVNRARELDQFASEHDAQLSFMLRPRRAAWSPGYLEQHAAAVGFVASSRPGRMHLPSDTPGHAPMLQFTYDAQAAQANNLDQTAVHEVHLSLDVPQVPRSEQPFARLRQVVQTLCESMDGVFCDQNGYQLLPQVLDPIEADLQKLYDRLDSRELSAGSMLARRLFN